MNEDENKIEEAAKILCSAKKPMIDSGGGVILSKASKELIKLTKLLNYPITIHSWVWVRIHHLTINFLVC